MSFNIIRSYYILHDLYTEFATEGTLIINVEHTQPITELLADIVINVAFGLLKSGAPEPGNCLHKIVNRIIN